MTETKYLSLRSLLLLKHSSHRTFVLALFDGLTLVVFFFAPANSDNHFRQSSVVYKHTHRNDGHTGFLSAFRQSGDFFLVKKQFSITPGFMVVICAVEIFGNIHIFDPHASICDVTKRVDQACLSLPKCFDFSSGQDNAGSKCVGNSIVECCPSVFYVNIVWLHVENLELGQNKVE